jgi:CheY-like chemotaxis protein
MTKFQAGQLLSSLERYRLEKFTGTIKIEAFGIDTSPSKVKLLVIAMKDGMITFADKEFPSPQGFAKLIQQKLSIPHLDAALKVSADRVKNKDSIRELFDFIARFGLLKWPELEAVLYKETLLVLEQIIPYSGELSLTAGIIFDLSYGSDYHGFDWTKLQEDLQQHQQLQNAMLPSTPVKESIPAQTVPLQSQSVPENTPKETSLSRALPIVLSVDDSSIVQTMIKRAISDRYEVLLANSAVTALNMLNSHPVSLLLLDVTMPDIDGLELCRTIRNMSKFRNLPIVMLTAKDGLLDKVRGQFAGTTHYLIKPVDREKLLPVLEKYIPVGATV